MKSELGSAYVLDLADPAATLERVGGKGASLARLAGAGLPVPPGFHITTDAYHHFVASHHLQEPILAAVAKTAPDQPATLEAAARTIAALFAQHPIPAAIADAIAQAYIRLGGDTLPVAVRSSATAEDLPDLSFAGQQESYLNIRGLPMVLDAVKRCWASLWTARAIGYRSQHQIDHAEVSLAVVVQELVPAEAAGVVFTANPLTGARDHILINAAWGLGETLVSGQVTPDTLVVAKASGQLTESQIGDKQLMTVRTAAGTRQTPVPADQRRQAVLTPPQAVALAQLSLRIEALYGQPVDIEWALAAAHFFIVQARPITTLHQQNHTGDDWNDSLRMDCLWTRGNLGEAVPDVMTPCTWSLIQLLMAEMMPTLFIGGYAPIGNIGGRLYMNLSVLMTIAHAGGMGRRRLFESIGDIFGRVPDDLEIPLLPLARWKVLRTLIPAVLRNRQRIRANQPKIPAFLASAPARCAALMARIQRTPGPTELQEFWHTDLLPYFYECCHMLEAGSKRDNGAFITVRQKLRKLVGAAETNALLAGGGAEANRLASLGPLLGLSQLLHGEIDQATYARQYGHHSPHEFEVSTPRPAEDPRWIDQQLSGLRAAPTDITALLARQQAAQAAAWARFQQRYPRQAPAVRRQIEGTAAAARDREATRSEVVRMFWALRAFVLRAGVLTGHGDRLFLLGIDEILALLGGDDRALAAIPDRQARHTRFTALPPYPILIRGPFNPFRWAADPQRRSDVFNADRMPTPPSATIRGFPGAPGAVEGRARVIRTAEESEQLESGEILVTMLTNVGWTPLFPRAAAVVTDIGAPLSHAAIVARELGIPAVVGCGTATMQIHTGDWLRIDGERGTVDILGDLDGQPEHHEEALVS